MRMSREPAHPRLAYVPDPSSNSILHHRGNIAEYAGGIHCLKYGNHYRPCAGARVVLSSGEISTRRRGNGTKPVTICLSFYCSEGTFGIATEDSLRLVPVPRRVRTLLADFLEVDDASHAVSAIIAAGVIPLHSR